MLFLAHNPSIVSWYSDLDSHSIPHSDPWAHMHTHTRTHIPQESGITTPRHSLYSFSTESLFSRSPLPQTMFLNFDCPLETLGKDLRILILRLPTTQPTKLIKISRGASHSPHITIFTAPQGDSNMQPRLWTTDLENLPSSPFMFCNSTHSSREIKCPMGSPLTLPACGDICLTTHRHLVLSALIVNGNMASTTGASTG